MKYIILLLASVGLLFGQGAHAQESTKQIITWSYSAEKKGDQSYTLHLKGTIAPGWKVLSKAANDDFGPVLELDSASQTRWTVGSFTENAEAKAEMNDVLESDIKYVENAVEYVIEVTNTAAGQASGVINIFAINGQEFLGPEPIPFRFKADAQGNLAGDAGTIEVSKGADPTLVPSIDLKNPVRPIGGIDNGEGKGLLAIFGLGFIGGLIALITPCVFPMIPMTVTFFTKSAQGKKGVFNAMLYGFFIFAIYVLLSLIFYIPGVSSDLLNNISTNIYLNTFFFVVFIIFAISFLGFFEISLPSSFASKVDSKANMGSVVGIFFMAVTLALVSFSCTGPILGSLLVSALTTDGGPIQLTMGMGGFGLALALPFALFALFPGMMNKLPKSGGWLDTVKKVLGFLELALAFKFLSNADLVGHWGILKREVFFAIWTLIALGLIAYLLGWLKLPHTSPVKKFTVGRIGTIVVLLAFTAYYLVPGMLPMDYTNRGLISGFPPPQSYSIYGGHHGVKPNVVNNYEEALALAKKENKPVLLDYTGWACVNCRKMEEEVWPEADIRKIIEKEYILVSLYVDDSKGLKEDEFFAYKTKEGEKKDVKTVGGKYARMQFVNFANQSQPMYAVISPDEKLMTLPVAYTPDAKEYYNWLKAGVDAFRTGK
ncbi:thioredoxin family protein [Chitinophaga horti]|uniref:Thioredoxin family protein n=1 Tax=Chitinophaga horti TaxID=2920382 RepID=A0ABY6J1A2_9BACT|nr:thioredoxin family protein [Chitinophaga horti]UYQ93328.1 thioredoxin family protein [Chitinophaga horti]